MSPLLRSNKSLIYNGIAHSLFWASYTIFLYFIQVDRLPPNRVHSGLSEHILLFVLPQIVLVYVNMEYLVPNFFINKKYFQYFLIILLLLVFTFLIMDEIASNLMSDMEFMKRRFDGDFNRIKGPKLNGGPRNFQNRFNPARGFASLNFILTLAILFLSTAIKTSQTILKREKESAQLKSENLDTELKLLRSQINPHFLFNSLNNIYNLSLKKSQRTPEFIVKLSEILRYIIYDCNNQKVPLNKEIDYIRNYISLQKLKDEDIKNVKLKITGETRSFMIEPMLLIPFIENSFKHSKIEDEKEGWIDINIQVVSRELQFIVKNSLPKERFSKDPTSGIGLENVKRRLSMLYPELHQLHIDQGEDTFYVSLSILL